MVVGYRGDREDSTEEASRSLVCIIGWWAVCGNREFWRRTGLRGKIMRLVVDTY